MVYSQPGEIILVPIVVDTQPEDFYGNIGDKISFSVSARGDNLTYQWQLSTNNGANWSASGASGYNTPRAYGFDLAEKNVGRLYRCKITDAAGNVVYSEPGKICLDQLTVTTQPEDYIGRVGDTVSFTIEARGEGLSYRWQVSNDGGSTWSNSSVDGFRTNSMSAPLTEARVGWLYRCQVTDGEGNVVNSEPGEIILLTENWSYTYDADGLRTSRSDGSTTYSYVYNGSSLVQMTVGSNTLYFLYDATSPTAVVYNGTRYYYATNLQGDIVAILNSSGTAVVEYTYDAWGKLLTTTGSMASTLGEHNPLRYRGYVYDTETTLYYLQSRYYNPEMGRFISADTFVSTGKGILGYNMFAYCRSNPVRRKDVSGTVEEDCLTGDDKGDLFENPDDAYSGSSEVISTDYPTGQQVGGTGATNQPSSQLVVSTNPQGTHQVINGTPSDKPTDVHHIVERCQEQKSGFSHESIEDSNNKVAITREVHQRISGFFSSKQDFTDGLRVRDWLRGQSFEYQTKFGWEVLDRFWGDFYGK